MSWTRTIFVIAAAAIGVLAFATGVFLMASPGR